MNVPKKQQRNVVEALTNGTHFVGVMFLFDRAGARFQAPKGAWTRSNAELMSFRVTLSHVSVGVVFLFDRAGARLQ